MSKGDCYICNEKVDGNKSVYPCHVKCHINGLYRGNLNNKK